MQITTGLRPFGGHSGLTPLLPADGDPTQSTDHLADQLRGGRLGAEELVSRYSVMLYERFGTYEEVARRANLDRQTAKRYVLLAKNGGT